MRDLAPQRQRIGAESIRLHSDLTVDAISAGLAAVRATGDRSLPTADRRALDGLKFSIALPEELARRTLSVRVADAEHATRVLAEQVSFRMSAQR
ncbi:hypothetical protein [Mycolicibacterium alvei]|uniref:Uncharacterized protein n=1 Tax=Mycolicibacterium alvei TaxID=67081 RepID=A0A6N4UQX5_9MYCO|nr:hypothetical protein [Mycolicibacterium alvei]MCV6999023.1 hypothetical protein [Mycolicibacterium alvei]BBX26325.1 hypothetical protein MALV_14500 [Mycolicibacterium alvei]